jgi:hypothetical protein
MIVPRLLGFASSASRYFTAIGLIGDPTAPVIGSGGAQNKNS